jgi:hypothetical protein
MVGNDVPHAEGAVMLARSFIATGYLSETALELARLPDDPKRVPMNDVVPLVRQMFDDFGLALPSTEEACWIVAAFVAEQVLDGRIRPIDGASTLWSLARDCDYPGELVEMLQLLEASEMTVPGAERDASRRTWSLTRRRSSPLPTASCIHNCRSVVGEPHLP